MTKAELQKLGDELEVELLDEPAKITFPNGVEWDDIYAIWQEDADMCVLRKQGTIHKFTNAWVSHDKTEYEENSVAVVQDFHFGPVIPPK